jgi:small conductance mechanosensitive channel
MNIPTNYVVDNLFNPATLPGAVFYAVIIIAAAWIIGRALGLTIHRYLTRSEELGRDSTGVRFIGQLARVVVYILAFLLYARLIPALQPLGTAWLASVGVVSLVVGLAAQSTLSNLVAGLSLVLYRPFRIGDRIEVPAPAGPEIGIVESINLGHTILCTSDGRRLVIPNGVIAGQTSINLSRSLPHIPCDTSVTVAEGTSIDQARKILLKAAGAVSKIKKINGCFVTGLTAQGIALTLSGMCVDPGDVAEIKSDILESSKKEFDAAGIKIA